MRTLSFLFITSLLAPLDTALACCRVGAEEERFAEVSLPSEAPSRSSLDLCAQNLVRGLMRPYWPNLSEVQVSYDPPVLGLGGYHFYWAKTASGYVFSGYVYSAIEADPVRVDRPGEVSYTCRLRAACVTNDAFRVYTPHGHKVYALGFRREPNQCR